MGTEFRGEFARVLGAMDGTIEVTFRTKDKSIMPALKTVNGACKIQFAEWKETRSNNANAYFHKLVDEIASETSTGRDEIKRMMVLDYGTVDFIARIPATAKPDSISAYYEEIGPSKGTKDPCIDYQIYKPTHTLNTAEMSRLIEGVVYEAQQLGIETRTPDQIANMLSLWDKGSTK